MAASSDQTARGYRLSEAVRPRRSWEIHSAAGIRIAGGEGPDWWDQSRPPDPPTPPAIYSTDCTPEPRA